MLAIESDLGTPNRDANLLAGLSARVIVTCDLPTLESGAVLSTPLSDLVLPLAGVELRLQLDAVVGHVPAALVAQKSSGNLMLVAGRHRRTDGTSYPVRLWHVTDLTADQTELKFVVHEN